MNQIKFYGMKKLLYIVGLLLLSISIWAQNFPFPQNTQWQYQHGIVAENVDNSKIQSYYSTWKSTFYEESGDLARIRFDDVQYTVSEGIGYGMLIFVYMENSSNNTQDEFDKLYNYYKHFGRFNGYLMEWKTTGFTGVNESGSATDGDLDVALALLLAHKQWGSFGAINYIQEAETLLGYIYDKQTENGLIKPGDHWNDAYNPCYFTNASIGLFAQAQDQMGFSSIRNWSYVYEQSQIYLTNAQNNSSAGFYPDWTTNSITATQGSKGFDFSWDACRTPWRVAWDYAWYGDQKALAMSNKTINWAKTKAPSDVYGPMNLSGTPLSDSYNNVCFIGGVGAAFMANSSYQSNLNTWYSYIANKTEAFGYYAPTVQILYLLTMSGNAINFYAESTGPVAPRFISAQNDPQNSSQITAVFSKELSSASVNSSADFTFSIDGQPVAISSVMPDPADSKNVIFVVASEITGGQTVTISYSGTSVKSIENVALEAFANKEVKNTISDGYVIANCESDHVTALGTSWFTFTDNADGGASSVDPLTTSTSPFLMTAGGAAGTDYAAKIVFEINKGTLGYNGFVGLGFDFNDDKTPFDLSQASGIAFWHKGSSGFVEIATSAISDGCNFYYEIPASDDWVQYNIPFADFIQYNWGEIVPWDASTVKTLQWKVQKGNSAAEEAMWVDEVVAVGMPAPIVEADKTELQLAIASANAALTGISVGEGHNQYLASEVSLLEGVLVDADGINENTAALQADVDAIALLLNDAVIAFNASKITVDFSDLTAVLSQANALKMDAEVGAGHNQYPQVAYSSFTSAVSSASAIVNTTGITEAEVVQATADLYEQIAVFEASKIIVDFTDLEGLILQANTIKNNAVIGDQAGQYTQAAYDAFVVEITSAVALVDATGITEAQVVQAITDLNAAIVTFENSQNELDISQLSNAIAQASVVLNSAVGGDGHNEYPNNQIQILALAVDDAQAVANSPVSQNEIDAMVQTLNTAVEVFNGSKIIVDFDNLEREIARASTLSANAVIGDGDGEYPQSAKTDLDAAISAAQQYYNVNGVTQMEVDQAKTNLVNAIVAFESSVNGINVSTLSNEIENATLLAQSASIGEGYNQYLQSDLQLLNDAIAIANTAKANSSATQDEIDLATANLQAAVLEFEQSVVLVDFSQLESVITTVSQDIQGVSVGEGHNQYSADAYSAVVNVLERAQGIIGQTGVTDSQVLQEIEDINTAFATFNASVIAIDFSVLDAKISEANSIKASAQTGSQEGQYPFLAYTAFSDAIVVSENISGKDGVTDAGVQQAVADLSDAIAVFLASEIGASVNYSILQNTISEADALLSAASVGSGHLQYVQSNVTALSAELSLANEVLNNTEATQSEVNDAVASLQTAITSFKNAQIIVDFSTLQNIVSVATNYANSVPIGMEPNQWTQATVDAFRIELSAAQAIDGKMGITNAEVVAEVSALSVSYDDFKNAYNKEQTEETDFVVLRSTVNEANLLKQQAESNTGNGLNQYSLTAISSFISALSAATVVANDVDASQVEVDLANYNLREAIVDLEKNALLNSVTYAESIVNVNVGSAEGQHPVFAQVSLQSSIDDAKVVLLNEAATKTLVLSAKSSLLSEITTFENTVNGAENPSTLADLVAQAKTVIALAKEKQGNGIGQYPLEVIKSYENAVNIAQAVDNNPSATETDKANTASNLIAQTKTFHQDVLFNTLNLLGAFISEERESAELVQLKTVYAESVSVYSSVGSSTTELIDALYSVVSAYNSYMGNPTNVGQEKLCIYPNPVAATLYIDAQVLVIEVYNASGQLVLSEYANIIDVSLLAAGSYTVVVKTEDSTSTARFVKE